MNNSNILVTDTDRRRLGLLLSKPECRAWGLAHWLNELESTLESAHSIEHGNTPEDVVTMNTAVTLVDLATGSRHTVTVVYPEDVDLVPYGVSVLEPLGIALIGHKVGDVVESPEQFGRSKLLLSKIVFQPEKAGLDYL